MAVLALAHTTHWRVRVGGGSGAPPINQPGSSCAGLTQRVLHGACQPAHGLQRPAILVAMGPRHLPHLLTRRWQQCSVCVLHTSCGRTGDSRQQHNQPLGGHRPPGSCRRTPQATAATPTAPPACCRIRRLHHGYHHHIHPRRCRPAAHPPPCLLDWSLACCSWLQVWVENPYPLASGEGYREAWLPARVCGRPLWVPAEIVMVASGLSGVEITVVTTLTPRITLHLTPDQVRHGREKGREGGQKQKQRQSAPQLLVTPLARGWTCRLPYRPPPPSSMLLLAAAA